MREEKQSEEKTFYMFNNKTTYLQNEVTFLYQHFFNDQRGRKKWR